MVSIILIFFNAERFIAEAIDSVLAQSYSDWELLLVDDGSTDDSTQIALDYASRMPERVRYLHHEHHANRGMSASRNLGISRAGGDFVAFIDADDVWLPRKLERQLDLLKSHPDADMIYGLTEYWYSWTGEIQDRTRDFIEELGVEPDTLIKPPVLLSLLLESKAPSACPTDMMLRRELLDRTGWFDESFRGMFEDQAFLSKVYLHASVFVAGEHWFRYRQHPDSCSARAAAANQQHRAGLAFFDWLEVYLIKLRVSDPTIWRALRDKRFRG